MNIGTINEGNKAPTVPQKVDVAVENKKDHNVETNNNASSKAVEAHLSEHPLKKYSVKLLNETLETQMLSISHFKQSMIQQSAKSDIETLRGLDIGKSISEAKDKPLFDFEEIANNVLDFVGGALTAAAQGGADQDTLNNMLGQARKGVDKGISEARKILGGDIQSGDLVDTGINKAHGLINEGFDFFGKQINDPERDTNIFSYKSLEQNISEKTERSTNLEIATKDGDKVSISFASMQEYQEILKKEQKESFQQGEDKESYFLEQKESLLKGTFNSNDFAFSVEGELDEGELKAIGDIVKDVSKLADEFFNGDVEAAFEQAKELGFDDNEISSFALDLKSTQTRQVQQNYKEVLAYQQQEGGKASLPESVAEPLKDYAAKLMDLVERSRESFSSEEDLASTVKDVVGHNFQLRGQDLLEAFNRFNHFNGKLLGSELFTKQEEIEAPIAEDNNSDVVADKV